MIHPQKHAEREPTLVCQDAPRWPRGRPTPRHQVALLTGDVAKNGLVQFPQVIISITPVVRLAGIKPGEIVFDGPTLADVYLGKIAQWDDPAIKKLNPNVNLPHQAITAAAQGQPRRSKPPGAQVSRLGAEARPGPGQGPRLRPTARRRDQADRGALDQGSSRRLENRREVRAQARHTQGRRPTPLHASRPRRASATGLLPSLVLGGSALGLGGASVRSCEVARRSAIRIYFGYGRVDCGV
jgi:hypothetical protein